MSATKISKAALRDRIAGELLVSGGPS